MKNIIRLFSIILCSVGPFACCYADTLTSARFAILRQQKTIGQMTTSSNSCNMGTHLMVQVEIKERFIMDIRISNTCENIIGKFGLLQSSIERKVNGDIKAWHKVKYENGKYTCEGKGSFEGPIPDKITTTTTTIYFHEPVGKSQVYSERFKKMVPLSYLGNGIYKMPLPNGDQCLLHYQEGQLVKMISDTQYGKITFLKV